jgi:hypothetical protein
MLFRHPKPAPRIANIARFFLIIHGLANMAQGFYSITDPYGWRELAPGSFKGTPDAAVQAIGICLSSRFILILGFYGRANKSRSWCIGCRMVSIRFCVPE